MADAKRTKRVANMRGFERRLAELESALVWLVKNHDNNYAGRTFTIDEQEVDSEDAWRHARRLLGHKDEDVVTNAGENYRDASERSRSESSALRMRTGELLESLRGVDESIEVRFHEGRPGGVFPPRHHCIAFAEATEGACLGDSNTFFILYGGPGGESSSEEPYAYDVTCHLFNVLRIVAMEAGVGVPQEEHYNFMAHEFYRETGHMAPGKDDARHVSEEDNAQRRPAWEAWRAQRIVELHALIADALKQDRRERVR